MKNKKITMLKTFPKAQLFTPLNLTSRIIFLNVFGLGLLVCGILYLDQFRQGLIDAKMQSLTIQARIIAAALATATGQKNQHSEQKIIIDPDQLIDLPWNTKYTQKEKNKFNPKNTKKQHTVIKSHQANVILYQLIPQTNKRGYVFNMQGKLIADSYQFRDKNRKINQTENISLKKKILSMTGNKLSINGSSNHTIQCKKIMPKQQKNHEEKSYPLSKESQPISSA